jgi:hypothetical protein
MRVANLRDPELARHCRQLAAEHQGAWRPLAGLAAHLARHPCAEEFAASTSHDTLCLHLVREGAEAGRVTVGPGEGELLEVRYEPPGTRRPELRRCSPLQLEAAVCARLLRLQAEAKAST